MIHPLHHKNIRKRIHQNSESYPSKVYWKRLLDRLVSVLGIGMTAAVLPQAIQIWSTQDAQNIPLFTWSYFLLYAVVMLVYGIAHNERPIIVIYSSNILVYLSIVTGIVLYS